MPVLSPSVMNDSSPMTGRESLLVTFLPLERSFTSDDTMMSGRLALAGSRLAREIGRGVPAKSGFGTSTLRGASAAASWAASASAEATRGRMRFCIEIGRAHV